MCMYACMCVCILLTKARCWAWLRADCNIFQHQCFLIRDSSIKVNIVYVNIVCGAFGRSSLANKISRCLFVSLASSENFTGSYRLSGGDIYTDQGGTIPLCIAAFHKYTGDIASIGKGILNLKQCCEMISKELQQSLKQTYPLYHSSAYQNVWDQSCYFLQS